MDGRLVVHFIAISQEAKGKYKKLFDKIMSNLLLVRRKLE